MWFLFWVKRFTLVEIIGAIVLLTIIGLIIYPVINNLVVIETLDNTTNTSADGIKSSSGYVQILDGNFKLNSVLDGIQTESKITIENGVLI